MHVTQVAHLWNLSIFLEGSVTTILAFVVWIGILPEYELLVWPFRRILSRKHRWLSTIVCSRPIFLSALKVIGIILVFIFYNILLNFYCFVCGGCSCGCCLHFLLINSRILDALNRQWLRGLLSNFYGRSTNFERLVVMFYLLAAFFLSFHTAVARWWNFRLIGISAVSVSFLALSFKEWLLTCHSHSRTCQIINEIISPLLSRGYHL